MSRVASQLLFQNLDLHFGAIEEEIQGDHWPTSGLALAGSEDSRDAQRSADILTRLIIDPIFASAVRTLRIYAPSRDSSMAFQTGSSLPAHCIIHHQLRLFHLQGC